jgi:flagellar hook-length control protein FliK
VLYETDRRPEKTSHGKSNSHSVGSNPQPAAIGAIRLDAELNAAAEQEARSQVLLNRSGDENGRGGEQPSSERQPNTPTARPEPSAPARIDSTSPTQIADQFFSSSSRNEHARELSGAQQARFVARVARAFQAAEGRRSPILLRLHPPELGGLKLEMRVQDSAIVARMEVDTSEARSLLLENVHLLRERLAEQGIRVEQFDVNLSERQTGNAFEESSQYRQQQSEHGRTAGHDEVDEEDRGTANPAPWLIDDGQLDVRI